MRVALVCIAKNEDNYIQEWIDYHKKVGFDDIFIYQNNWRWSGESENTHKINFDGKNLQIVAYNNFLQSYKDQFDWVAFFDVDEFLVLKKHKNIKEFLKDYSDFDAVGINWVLFGNNGHTKVDSEYSLIKRFTKRQSDVNQHIKSIVKMSKNINMIIHNPTTPWVNTEKQYKLGPFNVNGSIEIAQINHYFCKTEDEFIEKINRGKADNPTIRTMDEYEHHNFNEIEDLTALNFMYNDNNNILNAQR